MPKGWKGYTSALTFKGHGYIQAEASKILATLGPASRDQAVIERDCGGCKRCRVICHGTNEKAEDIRKRARQRGSFNAHSQYWWFWTKIRIINSRMASRFTRPSALQTNNAPVMGVRLKWQRLSDLPRVVQPGARLLPTWRDSVLIGYS